MKKTLRILLVVATMLLPLTTKAQNDSMLVNIAVNNPVMGTTTPAPGANYFHVGDTCHVVAMANEGYVLTGWDIQWSFMGTVLMDTTVNLPVADVFDLVGMINGGDGWVVQIGHNWYSFSVTANFVAASEYVPDSMVVNVAVNNATMGTTVPTPGAHYFYEGDTVSVVAVANDGYHLTGWTVQGYAAGNAFLDTTVNIAVPDVFEIIAFVTGQEWVVAPGYGNFSFNVTANFIEASQYIPDSMTVNVAVNNPLMGMTFPGTGTHKFAEGDTCHVVALANEGYHLTGWTIQVAFGGATYIDTTVNIAVQDAFDLMMIIDELRSAGPTDRRMGGEPAVCAGDPESDGQFCCGRSRKHTYHLCRERYDDGYHHSRTGRLSHPCGRRGDSGGHRQRRLYAECMDYGVYLLHRVDGLGCGGDFGHYPL